MLGLLRPCPLMASWLGLPRFFRLISIPLIWTNAQKDWGSHCWLETRACNFRSCWNLVFFLLQRLWGLQIQKIHYAHAKSIWKKNVYSPHPYSVWYGGPLAFSSPHCSGGIPCCWGWSLRFLIHTSMCTHIKLYPKDLRVFRGIRESLRVFCVFLWYELVTVFFFSMVNRNGNAVSTSILSSATPAATAGRNVRIVIFTNLLRHINLSSGKDLGDVWWKLKGKAVI